MANILINEHGVRRIAAAETAQTNGHADDDGDEELGPAMKPHHNI